MKALWGRVKEAKAKGEYNPPQCFGIPLDPNTTTIPSLVEKCTSWLLKNATDVEGVFRLSANYATLDDLTAKFNRGEEVNLEAPVTLNTPNGKTTAMVDAHTIAGLLKKWFRELPEPLCTMEMYDMWMAAASIKDKPTQRLQVRKVLSFLPSANQRLIKYLASFLRTFSAYSVATKMTAVNLSICFAPNLLRAPDTLGLQDQIEESPIATSLLVMFIESFDSIFEDAQSTQANGALSPHRGPDTTSQPQETSAQSTATSSPQTVDPSQDNSSTSNTKPAKPAMPGKKPMQTPRKKKRAAVAMEDASSPAESSDDSISSQTSTSAGAGMSSSTNSFTTGHLRQRRPGSGIIMGGRSSVVLDSPLGDTPCDPSNTDPSAATTSDLAAAEASPDESPMEDSNNENEEELEPEPVSRPPSTEPPSLPPPMTPSSPPPTMAPPPVAAKPKLKKSSNPHPSEGSTAATVDPPSSAPPAAPPPSLPPPLTLSNPPPTAAPPPIAAKPKIVKSRSTTLVPGTIEASQQAEETATPAPVSEPLSLPPPLTPLIPSPLNATIPPPLILPTPSPAVVPPPVAASESAEPSETTEAAPAEERPSEETLEDPPESADADSSLPVEGAPPEAENEPQPEAPAKKQPPPRPKTRVPSKWSK